MGGTPVNFSRRGTIRTIGVGVGSCMLTTSSVTGIGHRDAPEVGAEPRQWPMFQGDAARTGALPEATLEGDLQINWSTNVGEPIRSSAVVASNRAVVTTRDGTVTAFDLDTGDLQWQVSLRYEIVGSPVVADDIVCVPLRSTESYELDGDTVPISAPGELVGFDLNDGGRLWSHEFENELIGSPTLWEGDVFVVDAMGVLKRLAIRTGQELDQWDVSALQLHSPTISSGTVFLQTNLGQSLAIELSDGESWSNVTDVAPYPPPPLGESVVDVTIDAPLPIESPVSVAGDLVISAGHSRQITALDRASGRTRWEFSTRGTVLSTPAISEDRLFIGDSTGTLHCIDTDSGAEIWENRTFSEIRSSPIIAGDRLFICDRQNVYQIAISDGEVIDSLNVESPVYATPAVYEDELLLGTEAGEFYSIIVGGEPTVTSEDIERLEASLTASRTDVEVNNETTITLSVVNPLIEDELTVQLLLQPPSGVSITGVRGADEGSAQMTAVATVDSGEETNIAIGLQVNEPGRFEIDGLPSVFG